MSKAIHRRFVALAGELSPRLAAAIEGVGPVQLRRRDQHPLPEVLCRAVAGQQLSVQAASTIWRRVVDGAGGRPLIEHFAAVEPAALRACGLSAAKARTVAVIAEAALAGRLEKDELAALPQAERTLRLTALWGVGPWTADMIHIFYFGDPDVWPDGDAAARGALESLTSRRRKTRRTAERFAPHRSYLAVYMWRYLDAAPAVR